MSICRYVGRDAHIYIIIYIYTCVSLYVGRVAAQISMDSTGLQRPTSRGSWSGIDH